ncbi:MAG TPA: hypothetical protein VGR48_10220 [Terriglobales bacterium]|nr:hypothetical protein [Terriglobales bacterium]
MGSSFVQNLAFDEPNGYELSHETFAPAPGRVEQALDALGPSLIAMGGLALFGCALVVAFRIIALDAAHELRQPSIDFAICGAIALLGLTISWVHLGDNSKTATEDIAEESIAPPAPVRSRRQVRRQNGQACPFCGQNMMGVGSALYRCHTCGHLEGRGPVSFLDSTSFCNCAHCRQNS